MRRTASSNSARRAGFLPIVSTALSPSPSPRITRRGNASCKVENVLATTDGSRVSTLVTPVPSTSRDVRSEEHTSELQSHSDLVCRLLLEKKKKKKKQDRDSK